MDFAEGSTAPENQTKPYFVADDQILDRIFCNPYLKIRISNLIKLYNEKIIKDNFKNSPQIFNKLPTSIRSNIFWLSFDGIKVASILRLRLQFFVTMNHDCIQFVRKKPEEVKSKKIELDSIQKIIGQYIDCKAMNSSPCRKCQNGIKSISSCL